MEIGRICGSFWVFPKALLSPTKRMAQVFLIPSKEIVKEFDEMDVSELIPQLYLFIFTDKKTGKILGACMASVKGENLGHLLCWSIEMGLTVYDMLRMPFYHPVMEEALQAALYNLKGKLDSPDSHWPIELQPLIKSNP